LRDRMLMLMIPLASKSMDWMYAYNPHTLMPRLRTSAPRDRLAA
jgi:hypothetical protein